jgi:two-component system, OmpR family, phosphate regulon sensor histidine kinase PhoR
LTSFFIGILLFGLIGFGWILFLLYNGQQRLNQITKTINNFNKELQEQESQSIQIFEPLSNAPITSLEQAFNIFVAERKKEKERLNHLEQFRKEYIGNVAHELKTPIFNIQGYIETLDDGAIDDPDVNKTYVKKALNNVNRITTIIDDLDTITQLESGNLILDYEDFDIILLAKEVLESHDLLADKKNIVLRMSRDYLYPIMVNADKYRVRQVMNNLINNSIKYGVQKGRTEISLIKYGQVVEVSIIDSGLGIEAHHIPRLFERFYRIDKGRSREQGGSGLGLAIVKHIIEAMGQKIEVRSKIGKGTQFIFTLASPGKIK